ncbi:MAG: o-succinylbenzoate synthase [Balneolaceae bacterium]|nr:o-succinylbenzoate synthase [Balneolaceae bacterium]
MEIFQYRFPLARPFVTGRQTYTYRNGFILRWKTDSLEAYGEAAPLPGFSGESLQDVSQQLKEIADRLEGLFRTDPGDEELERLKQQNQLAPSVRFALDTLYHDLQAKKNGTSLCPYLFDSCRNKIPINSVVTAGSQRETLETIRRQVDRGIKTIKIKVGKDFDREMNIVKQASNLHSDIHFRLDANRSWTAEEAVKNLAILADYPIEYCEEPVRNPSVEVLEKLVQNSPIPIALDETLSDIPLTGDLLERNIAGVLIFKPMVLGDLQKIIETKRLADTHDYTTVFTTSLESGIGRMMTATLAAGLCPGNQGHGLDTGSLLEIDVWSDHAYIENGFFHLPEGAGLGRTFELSPEKLKLKVLER